MESAVKTITQLDLLKDRIEYDGNIFTNTVIYEKVLNRLLDDSKYIALSLRFPYQDYSNMELPSKYKNWQLRCCEELYNSIGTQGIKSYAENGLSWTRDSGYISHELRGEIEQVVGYIIPTAEESVENEV
jgi:hypothetical protein